MKIFQRLSIILKKLGLLLTFICGIYKADLEKLEAVVSEIAPQLRRAENLSWWTLIMLAEFIKIDLGSGRFWGIEKNVDEKYKDYLQTRELKF